MQYRKFGKLDWKASVLGFGCMRFPTKNTKADIDEPEAKRMLHYAIDHGVNYLDTAYMYHEDNSEPFLGRALKGGYREKIRLATKLPAWMVEKTSDFDRLLNEQLLRLQTEHIDFYLLHSLNKKTWYQVRDLGVINWAEGAVSDGRIGYLGFSFHDEYEVFQEIVDAYDGWKFCQIQLNYMCEDFQAGIKGLQYAASKDLAVVIMEPIMGGGLANPPKQIKDIWADAVKKRSPSEWALQWVWNWPEVSVVLSGMSTMEQVNQNIESANASSPNALSEDELALVRRVRDKYFELQAIPCTRCEYCMPCPNDLDIPRNLEIFNYSKLYDDREKGLWEYDDVPEKNRASSCIQCLECEEKCPQNIEISKWMKLIHKEFGKTIED